MNSYLEKQNAALLKALQKRAETDQNFLLQMLIEQQRHVLSLTKKIGELTERDSLRERQMQLLHARVRRQ